MLRFSRRCSPSGLLLLASAAAASAPPLAAGAPEADRVTELPGWPGAPPTPWWSGYLDFGKKHLHYILVESELRDPNAPLILWMNGGPGCSSLDGLFYEHGPLLIDRLGSTLYQNPYAWNKIGSVLYLEAPVGVGYSYSDDPEDLLTLNDDQTATDNLAALKVFFSRFPEYKSRPFFVSGESYAGVYVPTLSYKIFKDPTVDWDMRGFIVGNGIFEWALMQKSSVDFLFGHGALSRREKAKIDGVCKDDYGSDDCQKLLDEVENKIVAGLNLYDFYRSCFHPSGEGSALGSIGGGLLTGRRIARQPELLRQVVQMPRPPHPALGEGVPCIDSVGGTVWLSNPKVREALHINPSLPDWTICSGRIKYERNMSYVAQELYAQMKDKYQILVYNGDTDMACDYIADSLAVDSINATADPKYDWAPWKIVAPDGEQIAGYMTKYDTAPGMFFATVKGAGHMVPQWKPQAALELLDRFIHNKPMVDGGRLDSIVV